MTAEGKTRKGVDFLAKVVEKDTTLARRIHPVMATLGGFVGSDSS
jgi:hypothetical protein